MIVDITPESLAEAARRLRGGELVAIPTETVYGLGANALDASAVARIYEAKGRPAWNPLIVHVPDVAAARELVEEWPDDAERLAGAFWPGPLTLVLRKHDRVPDIVTAGSPTIALRVPAHEATRELLRLAGVPVAAPSANRFTQLSPTTAEHVAQSLGDRVPLILDGGPCSVGIESTVVDLTGETPQVLRPGMLGAEALSRVLGRTVSARAAHAAPEGEAHRSPGMSERHYAPRAEVWLASAAERDEVQAAIARLPHDAVGLLALEHGLRLDGVRETRVLPRDPAAYARALYATLHALDRAGCRVIVIEAVPETESWTAVRDRLRRSTK